jgi:glycosyltransferase involved in cell wall biosynthesis
MTAALTNILFVTPILPVACDTGGVLFSQAIIDHLRKTGAAVLPVGWAGASIGAENSAGIVGKRAVVTRYNLLAAAGWMARALLYGEPYTIAKFRSGRFDRMVRWHALQADVVVIDHEMDWVLDLLPPGMRVIHVSHQIASAIYEHDAGMLYRREARLLRRAERRLAVQADQIWTITPDDAVSYLRLGARDTRYLPYTPASYDAPIDRRVSRYDCVLLGTWSWQPNRTGLRWFLEQVGPRLRSCSIGLAGRGSLDFAGALPNLSCLGQIPDDLAFLRSGRVIAVPSIDGVGLQTKVLKALEAGVFVVATHHAMRHIEERPGHLLLADTPEDFAAAIERAQTLAPMTVGDTFANRRAEFRDALIGGLSAILLCPKV